MKNQKLKKRVYYVGDVGCRDTALAIHARNMGYMFKKLNYDVVYFCENWDTQRHYNSDKDFKYFYTKKYLKESINSTFMLSFTILFLQFFYPW